MIRLLLGLTILSVLALLGLGVSYLLSPLLLMVSGAAMTIVTIAYITGDVTLTITRHFIEPRR